MSDQADRLRELLRAPVHSPADAQRAAHAAAALAELLRAQMKADEVLGGAESASSRSQGAPSLAGTALQDAALQVLDEAGVPLHARELGARIKARGWRHRHGETRADQIIHQLAARLPRYPQFRRVGPNTFALAKWQDEAATSAVRKPRVATFKGPGGDVARRIGDSADLPAASEWRSS